MSLWDVNWATSHGVGKLTARAFNQLRSACVERTTAAGRSIPALLASDIPTNGRVRRVHRAALHNEVSALISAYVNHTDNAGNWNGQITIPAWTEATILTAIGDSVRLPIPNDHINCASWNWQTKRILDLLRWVILSGSLPAPNTSDIKSFYRSGYSDASAISIFNSMNYGDSELPLDYGIGFSVIFTNNPPSPSFYQHIWRARWMYNYNNATPFNIKSDLYTFFTTNFSGHYWNGDYLKPENQLSSLIVDADISPSQTFLYEIGNFNDCPVLDTAPHYYSWKATLYNIILKYDGPGGFGYLDS